MAPVRSCLTLENKIEVIKCYDAKKQTVRELANQFNVGKTQIATILKSRVDLLRKWCDKNANEEANKKFMKGKGFEIDHLCYEWFCRALAKHLPISGPLIQEKAVEIAETFGDSNFEASNEWLDEFLKRHNIVYKAVCGESSSVGDDIVDDWNSELVEMCEGFVQKNIFNLDETGSFFRTLPDNLTQVASTICPTNAPGYSSIDKCLQTEDVSSLNIGDIINDGVSENAIHDVKQEEYGSDGVDGEKLTVKEALQLTNRLKTFCLNNSDAVSLSLVTQLQSRFEEIAIYEKKTN